MTLAADARRKVFLASNNPVDIVVTTQPEHIGYIGGYRSMTLDIERGYQMACVASPEMAVLVVGAADWAPALEVLRNPEYLFPYGTFFIESRDVAVANDPASQAVSFASALKAAVGAVVKKNDVVGVDLPYGTAGLANAFTGVRTVECSSAFRSARATKLPGEIERLALAARLAERGIERALGVARSGMTELEIASIITKEIVIGGGVPKFVVVTSGERSALVDAYPSPKRLSSGDLVRMDIGCTVDGYWADTARTAVVGEPTTEQSVRYDAILAGEQAQFDKIRAGAKAADLFRVAVSAVRQSGIPSYRRQHCGHGLGLECHEYPTLAPAAGDDELREGMVLCVETPFYEFGWGGLMVEDTVLVTERGHEKLTSSDRTLRVI